MASQERGSPSDRRKTRPILSLQDVSQRAFTSSHAGSDEGSTDSETQPDTQGLTALEMALYAERNAWDIKRRSLPSDASDWVRGGGFAGRGLLKPADASNLWEKAKAQLAKAGGQ